jgi:3-oxoacyl-[acyl-carrier protein] reductase
MMTLNHKIIAVTGAAQGLGRTISTSLCEKGAIVVLLDINQTALQNTAEQLKQQNFQVHHYHCDIANEQQVRDVFQRIKQDVGDLDGLVNNAGVTRDGLLVKASEDEVTDGLSLSHWQQVIDINLTGVFLCGREAAKAIIAADKPGVIVNISSISRHGNLGQSNYAAAKAGVAALTTTWAKELARYNIRCAAIAPGFIETEMTQAIKPQILDKIKQSIPLKSMGQPEHIAHSVVFIIENDYISGRIIEVDGALRL